MTDGTIVGRGIGIETALILDLLPGDALARVLVCVHEITKRYACAMKKPGLDILKKMYARTYFSLLRYTTRIFGRRV